MSCVGQPPSEGAAPEPEKKRAGVVSMEDLDSTLYFLDEREIEYLRAGLAGEGQIDLHRDCLAIVLDIFEVQADTKVREEILGILESFMLHLLSSGAYGSVAYLLREAAVAADRANGASYQFPVPSSWCRTDT